jgi:hypothetical protein
LNFSQKQQKRKRYSSLTSQNQLKVQIQKLTNSFYKTLITIVHSGRNPLKERLRLMDCKILSSLYSASFTPHIDPRQVCSDFLSRLFHEQLVAYFSYCLISHCKTTTKTVRNGQKLSSGDDLFMIRDSPKTKHGNICTSGGPKIRIVYNNLRCQFVRKLRNSSRA